jgi:2'-hydroxyisoflavone reductase
VTLFNRGRQNAHLFPELEKLRGDRDGDLAALVGRRFDAVIDLSGYTPAHVGATAAAVDTGYYLFISTITAHRAYPPGRPYDEDAPLHDGAEGYGPLKARAEEAIEAALPGRVCRVRPGLVVGPYDPTERFTYWPRRVALGGDACGRDAARGQPPRDRRGPHLPAARRHDSRHARMGSHRGRAADGAPDPRDDDERCA